MPVIIRSADMKYKDSQGRYIGVNAVAERATADMIADIEEVAAQQRMAIEEAGAGTIEDVEQAVADSQAAVAGIDAQRETMIAAIANVAGQGTDSTFTQPGVAADAAAVGALNSAINDLTNEIKWTDEATDVLDAIGSAIPFTSAQGGELWDNLISILRGTFVSHSVVWSGSNYTASNTSTHIADEALYSCTVTPVEGFVISALTVTMGNAAIVPTQNQDGTYSITIASVTDDVIIAVTTSLDPSALIYHVEDLVCDGTQEAIETPLEFDSASANGVTEAWTLCATATGAADVPQYCFVFCTDGNNTRLSWDTYNNNGSRVRGCGNGEEYSKISKLKDAKVSVVVTHEAEDRKNLTVHFVNKTTGEYESTTFTSANAVNDLNYANGATPLRIGDSSTGSGKFKGTINDITIHHRVLTSQEIEEYLLGGDE